MTKLYGFDGDKRESLLVDVGVAVLDNPPSSPIHLQHHFEKRDT